MSKENNEFKNEDDDLNYEDGANIEVIELNYDGEEGDDGILFTFYCVCFHFKLNKFLNLKKIQLMT